MRGGSGREIVTCDAGGRMRRPVYASEHTSREWTTGRSSNQYPRPSRHRRIGPGYGRAASGPGKPRPHRHQAKGIEHWIGSVHAGFVILTIGRIRSSPAATWVRARNGFFTPFRMTRTLPRLDRLTLPNLMPIGRASRGPYGERRTQPPALHVTRYDSVGSTAAYMPRRLASSLSISGSGSPGAVSCGSATSSGGEKPSGMSSTTTSCWPSSGCGPLKTLAISR